MSVALLKMAFLIRAICLAVALLSVNLVVASPATAQSQLENDAVGGQVPGGVLGTQSDTDYWRALRQGATGTVVGPDPERGLLIQSQGNDWRHFRLETVGKYAAWSILSIIIVLALFFAIRGRIKIGVGFSNTTIQRFSMIERVGHWLLASSFIILGLTGLNVLYGRQILIPFIGKDAFSTIAYGGKYIHNFVAFAFIVGLIMVTVMWISHNIPNKTDIKWFLSGGGLLGKNHPSAYKFNGGQKILFWLIVLCGVSISLSGWTLLYPFTTSLFSDTFSLINSIIGTQLPTPLALVQEQQLADLWHIIMACVMIVIVIAHIYIGTIGMEGAVDAMTSGNVDLNWAKEHHDLWVGEVSQGSENPKTPPRIHPAE